MDIYFYLFLFILGICWGSFANVLIDRTQKGKSILGRSKCDFCKFTLKWFDNIPLLSFFFIKGRCRKCKKKLSWQYPLVEMLTGLVFVMVFAAIQETKIFEINNLSFLAVIFLVYYLGITYLLWIILVWDFKYMIIPDFLILIGVFITVFYNIYQIIISNNYWEFLVSPLLGAIILSGFFGFLYWFSRGKWIGGGDVKLGFWLGLMAGIKMIYFLILIAYTSGALVAIGLLIFKNKKMKSEIPFGPFLVLATWVVIFYKDLILKIWYSLI